MCCFEHKDDTEGKEIFQLAQGRKENAGMLTSLRGLVCYPKQGKGVLRYKDGEREGGHAQKVTLHNRQDTIRL